MKRPLSRRESYPFLHSLFRGVDHRPGTLYCFGNVFPVAITVCLSLRACLLISLVPPLPPVLLLSSMQRQESLGDSFSRGDDAEGDAGPPLSPAAQDGGSDFFLAPAVSSENFKVAIRVRPPLPRELEGPRPFINVVRIPDHRSITLCEHLDTDDGRSGVYSTQSFTFDYVYDPSSRQREVYEHSAQSAVLSVLQGYNATVIAYGQTGTGKTYTMEGFTNDEHRGIIPRSTEEMFAYIAANRGNTNGRHTRFQVRASYLQIYNEVISDLLKPHDRQSLTIRQSKQRVFVEGLSEWVVRSPHEIYGLMERGCSMRATGSTKMSELSSRSHAIFVIVVEISEEDGSSYKVGKLNIVDLAGSEKVRQTGVTGVRLKETQKINWSLHLLGNVIEALTDAKRRDKHVPYRNSKLTHLLTDSLGGNCKTTLIACLSPAFDSYQESLSTLKFANRAKNIKNEVSVNEDLSDPKALVAKYEREIRRLRSIITERGGGADLLGAAGVELEERHRRSEEHRDAALEALQESSRAYDEERRSRQALTERIAELEDQLAQHPGGGDGYDWHSAHEEDQAQVERYKHLLLKQRDVMLSLTTRVNERDESILRLQEEIDAYDAHVQRLEEMLDAAAPPRFHTRTEAEAWLSKTKVVSRSGEVKYRSDAADASGGSVAMSPAGRTLTADEKLIELVMMGNPQNEAPAPPGGRPGGLDASTFSALERLYRDLVHDAVMRFASDKVLLAQQENEALRAAQDSSEERVRQLEFSLSVLKGAGDGNPAAIADRMRGHIARETDAVKQNAQERMGALSKELAAEREERKRLARELDRIKVDAAVLSRQGLADPQAASRVAQHIQSVQDSLHSELVAGASPAFASVNAAASRLARADAKGRPDPQSSALLEEKDAVIRQLQDQVAASATGAKEFSQLKRQLASHVKDRKALKTILEQRIRTKLATCLNLLRDGELTRATSDLNGLVGLVDASITAMDADGS